MNDIRDDSINWESTARQLLAAREDLIDIAAAMSHDLRSPLHAISGFSRLLQLRYHDQLDSEANEYLDFISQNVKRMDDLIAGMLSYARLSADEPPQMTDVSQLVQIAWDAVAVAREESEAVLELGPMPTIPVRPDQLILVFKSLFENAIQFHRETPPHITVKAHQASDYWHFAVSDNGTGIDPVAIEKIFTLLARGHIADPPTTGMGLALCRKIIRDHGGAITASSKPGIGSTLQFTLPC